jgi:MinD-like ATPase involved in chromosome partitioning or flagellar assembly
VNVPVLVAVNGPGEVRLVTGLDRCGGIRVVRRCADLAELVAAAEAGLGRAVVLTADLDHLDREVVSRLSATGLGVVGLTDPARPDQPGPADLGITRVLPVGSPAERVAEYLLAAAAESRGRRSDHGSAVLGPAGLGTALGSGPVGRPGAAGGTTLPVSPSPVLRPPPLTRPDDGSPGRLVAVSGTAGAPGRTTVAVNLALELAASGRPVLLVDADTYAPSIAQVLGVLDESSGVAAAVRAANRGALDSSRLLRLAPLVTPTLRVLTGIGRPQRWPELRASGLQVVWDLGRRLAAHVVVDCGWLPDADEELSSETAAPRRNQAARSTVSAADDLVVVGVADPVGLQRLVGAVQDLAELPPAAPEPLVVVNRVRASAVGPRPERRVRDVLLRFAGVACPFLVAEDTEACDTALLAGRGLAEVALRSPARLGIAALADRLGGISRPGRERPRALRHRHLA